MKNILVIDTGTSSMRAVVFNALGQIIDQEQIAYFVDVKDNVTVEQDAYTFKDTLEKLCTLIGQKAEKKDYAIHGIALTSQRSSVVPVSKEGEPLMPIIMWYDKRPQSLCDQLEAECGATVYNTCGMNVKPMYSAPKMLWIKRNKPEIYKQAHKLMGIHDYLLHCLTEKFVTDTSLASRTCLLDIQARTWSDTLMNIFDIDRDKLCSLVEPGSVVGGLTGHFARKTGLDEGIPIISAGGDQQCSAIGLGITGSGQVGLTSGTATYAVSIIDAPILDANRHITLNIGAQKGTWMIEASNMSSGAVYNWIGNLMYANDAIEQMNAAVVASPIGAKGLFMLPSLAGTNYPTWDSFARGAFINIGFEHQKSDFIRATVEGIASEVLECVEILCQHQHEVDQVISAGGLSKLDAYNQMIADMSNRKIHRSTLNETTAVGAWAVAATELGITPSVKAAIDTRTMDGNQLQGVFVPSAKAYQIYACQKKARQYLKASIHSQEFYSSVDAMQATIAKEEE